jgi:hypothetical protein
MGLAALTGPRSVADIGVDAPNAKLPARVANDAAKNTDLRIGITLL